MFVLGVSWLILTPLCLWNLFRGGTLVRLTSVLSLVALEAATIWATTLVQAPARTPIAAPPSPAMSPAVSPAARTEPWLRIQSPPTAPQAPTPLPEAAQQGARDTRGAQAGPEGRIPGDGPGERGASGARDTSCRGRMPAPERVRLARRQGAPRGVTLFWKAREDECDTATVVLHHRKRTIKVWMREDRAERLSPGATTWPVSIAGGVASLEVPLTVPVRDTGAFRAIDGRTGRPIALIRPGRVPEEPSEVR
ncbi:hypothetical protein GCM10022252_37830 [Streptosporangium oxazolinicum]|uniref:Integral membrane protein n=1 Tax=Streptosporangium oxazolinicum TaxID=909287 RepID=A0ABP8AZ11_9ACTN